MTGGSGAGRDGSTRARFRSGTLANRLSEHGFAVGAALLGAIATAESWIHAARAVAPEPNRPLLIAIIVLLGLASTVPVALADTRPALAAGLVTGALLVSMVATETLTFAGAAAQLVTGYQLGIRGPGPPSLDPAATAVGRPPTGLGARLSRLSALLFAAPFPLLALIALSGSVSQTQPGGAASTVTVESPVDVRGFVVRLALLAVLAPIAALAGIARRSAREAAAGRAAARTFADTLLEHTARGERARIARELHDVVAHHISMVAVQAETARLTTPGMPEAGAQRLRAIGDTARAALTEMRRLLGVLREDTGTEPARLQPQPGLRLRELNALLDETRDASGAGIRLVLKGQYAELDPGVELAAYRIIQEALTNARRHAPGAAVDVTLHYTQDELLMTIRDNGPGPSTTAPVGGHGLSGMRERAAAVGGQLTTTAASGGGFRVDVRLPTTDEAAA
ncbi:sensor histidine kinase [Stackebrandtia nassauensis]|uniref:sensor histidine kinase n=1 Tax=Stackebrandtia nassauensis TaxID=283811 RepID=UPI0002E15431|nr:sensor histidine kinase [Stackebrandtia nassauensis]